MNGYEIQGFLIEHGIGGVSYEEGQSESDYYEFEWLDESTVNVEWDAVRPGYTVEIERAGRRTRRDVPNAEAIVEYLRARQAAWRRT